MPRACETPPASVARSRVAGAGRAEALQPGEAREEGVRGGAVREEQEQVRRGAVLVARRDEDDLAARRSGCLEPLE